MATVERAYRQIADFAQKRGVRRVTLFGSRARGDNAPRSDIDIAVEGCTDYEGFCDDVQERLDSLLQVDVVCLDLPVSPELMADIERDGRMLYEKV